MVLVAILGCEDVSRFTTGPDESFCGSIVPGPFVRQGFGPGVRMRLKLDAERLGDQPGSLTTDDNTFATASLRAIPQLAHDELSTMTFGEGRIRNLILGVQPAEGSSAMAIVSLLENDDVEVRVLRGTPPVAGETTVSAENDTQLFGVFSLARQKGTCGF